MNEPVASAGPPQLAVTPEGRALPEVVGSMTVGLQPARMSDVRTHLVLIAHALENGAGYAPELGRPENLKKILDDILTYLARRFEDPKHESCTESCPDCLRSYDNRRIHGAL